MFTKAFRPQQWNGRFKINRRVGMWHWHIRRNCNDHKYRIIGRLHYLASHAPLNVAKKWTSTCRKLEKRYRKLI